MEQVFAKLNQQVLQAFDQLRNRLVGDVLLQQDPEICYMTMPEMLENHGYPVESYEITTEDGYILTLIRVPGGKRDPVEVDRFEKEQQPLRDQECETVSDDNKSLTQDGKDKTQEKTLKKPKPSVLIVHGFQCQGSNWFVNHPDKCLPYNVVDSGFDCWVANLRGTHPSKQHISLKTNSKKYWNFSWHEMGIYDLTAIINFILETTGNESIYYVGHSMGCSAFFALMSTKPEYCSKVKAMVALGPAVYGKHCRNKPTKFAARILSSMGKSKMFRQKQISPKSFAQYAKAVCPPFKSPEQVGGWVGIKYGSFFGAFGHMHVEKSLFAKLASQFPSSTSAKTLCHGMQCVASKQFNHYDYGRSENIKRYGQAKPPEYDIKSVTVPVATFYAEDDELCTAPDVTQLSKDLPNAIGNFGVTLAGFTHGDFMMGNTVDVLVYNKILKIFHKCEKQQSDKEEIIKSDTGADVQKA